MAYLIVVVSTYKKNFLGASYSVHIVERGARSGRN